MGFPRRIEKKKKKKKMDMDMDIQQPKVWTTSPSAHRSVLGESPLYPGVLQAASGGFRRLQAAVYLPFSREVRETTSVQFASLISY